MIPFEKYIFTTAQVHATYASAHGSYPEFSWSPCPSVVLAPLDRTRRLGRLPCIRQRCRCRGSWQRRPQLLSWESKHPRLLLYHKIHLSISLCGPHLGKQRSTLYLLPAGICHSSERSLRRHWVHSLVGSANMLSESIILLLCCGVDRYRLIGGYYQKYAISGPS
jgi:hypothetical protein